VARPVGLEPTTSCLEAIRTILPNLARGVANRTDSASWGKFLQPAFSCLYCYLRHLCRRFLQFALHFRDSIAIQPNASRELVSDGPGRANCSSWQTASSLRTFCRLNKRHSSHILNWDPSFSGYLVRLTLTIESLAQSCFDTDNRRTNLGSK
jgi:hypothetical protein